jgi:hypothetical protein
LSFHLSLVIVPIMRINCSRHENLAQNFYPLISQLLNPHFVHLPVAVQLGGVGRRDAEVAAAQPLEHLPLGDVVNRGLLLVEQLRQLVLQLLQLLRRHPLLVPLHVARRPRMVRVQLGQPPGGHQRPLLVALLVERVRLVLEDVRLQAGSGLTLQRLRHPFQRVEVVLEEKDK